MRRTMMKERPAASKQTETTAEPSAKKTVSASAGASKPPKRPKKGANNWINFLIEYRITKGGDYSKTKDGNNSLMKNAGEVWKAMSQEDKNAYLVKDAAAESKAKAEMK